MDKYSISIQNPPQKQKYFYKVKANRWYGWLEHGDTTPLAVVSPCC